MRTLTVILSPSTFGMNVKGTRPLATYPAVAINSAIAMPSVA